MGAHISDLIKEHKERHILRKFLFGFILVLAMGGAYLAWRSFFAWYGGEVGEVIVSFLTLMR